MWKKKKNKHSSNLSKLEISAPLTEPAHIGASSSGGINLTNIAKVPQPAARPSNNLISQRTPQTGLSTNSFQSNPYPNFAQNAVNYHQRQPSQTSRSTPTPPPQIRHNHTPSNASSTNFSQNVPHSSSNNSLSQQAPPAPPPRPSQINEKHNNSNFIAPPSPSSQPHVSPLQTTLTSTLEGNIPSTSQLLEVKLSRRPKGDFGFSLRRQVYSKRLESTGHSIRQAIFFAEPGGNVDYDIGLQKEDQLLKVNGIDIAGKGQQEIVDIIKSRGNLNSYVILTVARHNFSGYNVQFENQNHHALQNQSFSSYEQHSAQLNRQHSDLHRQNSDLNRQNGNLNLHRQNSDLTSLHSFQQQQQQQNPSNILNNSISSQSAASVSRSVSAVPHIATSQNGQRVYMIKHQRRVTSALETAKTSNSVSIAK